MVATENEVQTEISQRIWLLAQEKEEELVLLREKISEHEKDLWLKDSTIHRQSNEIDALLEKQNKKWWQFWR